jgi:hypothetical protein
MTKTEKLETKVCGNLRANLGRPDSELNRADRIGCHVGGTFVEKCRSIVPPVYRERLF